MTEMSEKEIHRQFKEAINPEKEIGKLKDVLFKMFGVKSDENDNDFWNYVKKIQKEKGPVVRLRDDKNNL